MLPGAPPMLSSGGAELNGKETSTNEVEVFRYITRRSLDAYRWQTLTRKANFIGQLRAGAHGSRSAEDIDSPLPEAAMIKAAATGNPLIIEHAELSKEVRELEAAKRGHERSMAAAKTAYGKIWQKIAGYEKAIPGLRLDTAQAQKIAEAAFSLTIGERRFDERKPAGEALKAILLSKAARLHDGHSQKAFLQASMHGFKLEATVRHGASGLYYMIDIERDRGYAKADSYLLTDQLDPVGLIRRFENCIKQVPAVLAGEEQTLVNARADLPRLERQLTATAFARSDRLLEAKARIAVIEKALQPDEPKPHKEIEPAPAGAHVLHSAVESPPMEDGTPGVEEATVTVQDQRKTAALKEIEGRSGKQKSKGR